MTGRKDDMGKLKWHLMIWGALEDAAYILTKGAAHYGAFNWRGLEGARDRYFSAMMRHAVSGYVTGKPDRSSGRSHWAHVICNAMFLWWLENEPTEAIPKPIESISETEIVPESKHQKAAYPCPDPDAYDEGHQCHKRDTESPSSPSSYAKAFTLR